MKTVLLRCIVFLSVCCGGIPLATAAQPPVFATPQAASKALFEAWRAKNRAKALQVANKASVDKLFGTLFRRQRRLTGCHDASDTEKGLYYCVYQDSEDDLLSVAFYMKKTKNGWRIHLVSFSAEG
jgi:hypothetical protein